MSSAATFDAGGQHTTAVRRRGVQCVSRCRSGLLFLSGVTGTGIDGDVPSDPAEQFERSFLHLRLYLEAAGASLPDIIECEATAS